METIRPIDLPFECHRCGHRQRAAWSLVTRVSADDSWQQLRAVLEVVCPQCGGSRVPALPAVVLEGSDDEVRHTLAVLPPGIDDLGPLRDFLPPEAITPLLPVPWPAGPAAGRPIVEAARDHPETAARARRNRIMAGLERLLGSPTAHDAGRAVADCPELRTPLAAEVGAEWVALIPPEGDALGQAITRLLAELAGGADVATAHQRYLDDSTAAREAIRDAALDHVEWLTAHPDAPVDEWDALAERTQHLFGIAGDTDELARHLLRVGNTLLLRPDRTRDDHARAAALLERSHQLAATLDDAELSAAVASSLAHAIGRTDIPTETDLRRAAALQDEVVRGQRAAGDPAALAMALTNHAVVLLRLATFRRDAAREETLRQGVTLLEEALPLRTPERDPLGWAYTAANLAQTRRMLGDDDPAQAARVQRAAADIFAAAGETENAVEARIHLGRALVDRARAGGADRDALLAEAAALAEQPGNPLQLAQFAQISVRVAEERHGRTPELVEPLATALGRIDPRWAPDEALSTAEQLATLHAELDQWPEACRAYDHCLAVQEAVLDASPDRGVRLDMLAAAPRLARGAAFARVRAGDPTGAVELLERTRLRAFEAIGGDLAAGLSLLTWQQPTLADIGQAATPDCPLTYVVTTPGGSAVLLVRRDETGQVVAEAHDSELTSATFIDLLLDVGEPERGLITAQAAGEPVHAAVERLAEPLGRLLQPVVDAAAPDRLLLVPCGPMALMPWPAARLRDAPVISVVPSAAAAVLSRRRIDAAASGRHTGRVVVFADPARDDVPPLRGARAEAERIHAEFGDRVVVRGGAEATRDELIRLAPDAWLLHLSCHGYNDPMGYEAMRLLLSGGDLTLDDLRAMPRLRARLVTLSACQTGHADLVRLSDDMIGLPVTLLAAGSAAVLATLWPVHDRATAKLIDRMYRELARMIAAGEPDDVPLALHRAQRWLSTQPRYRHPAYWAAFYLLGV